MMMFTRHCHITMIIVHEHCLHDYGVMVNVIASNVRLWNWELLLFL
jgi:hypothetical protein